MRLPVQSPGPKDPLIRDYTGNVMASWRRSAHCLIPGLAPHITYEIDIWRQAVPPSSGFHPVMPRSHITVPAVPVL